MRKFVRFAVWGVGAVGVVAAAIGGVVIYQHHLQSEKAEMLRVAQQTDATELAKCTSRSLTADALRGLVVSKYHLGGFEFREAVRFFAERSLGNIEPKEVDFLRVARRSNWFDWQAFGALMERCKPKYGAQFDERYRNIYWSALEEQAEFLAVLQQVTAENDAILAPFRRIKDAKEKSANMELMKRDAALFKNPS